MTINDDFDQEKEIKQNLKENNKQQNKYKVKEIISVKKENNQILY